MRGGRLAGKAGRCSMFQPPPWTYSLPSAETAESQSHPVTVNSVIALREVGATVVLLWVRRTGAYDKPYSSRALVYTPER